MSISISWLKPCMHILTKVHVIAHFLYEVHIITSCMKSSHCRSCRKFCSQKVLIHLFLRDYIFILCAVVAVKGAFSGHWFNCSSLKQQPPYWNETFFLYHPRAETGFFFYCSPLFNSAFWIEIREFSSCEALFVIWILIFFILNCINNVSSTVDNYIAES